MSDSETDATSVGARLLELQAVDTDIAQLRLRRDRLPELEHLATASASLSDWEAERARLRARLDELERDVESAEEKAEELGAERTRLEAQLKTVIAPREAEALMHEIETVTGRRDEVELGEIAALEEQSEVDDRLTEHLAVEESLRNAARSADAALAAASGELDAELSGLETSRDQRRAAVDATALARYDRNRRSGVVAVGQLDGARCTGCHLDLSAAEIDDLRDDAARSGGLADCPNCGAIIVV